MSSFSEANQVRLMLKMKLSRHSWYSSSTVISINDGFGVLIEVVYINNHIRKEIPPVINGVSVKTEIE
jgi:hypothetical protein